MLDIKVIREDPERVKAAVRSRNGDLDAQVDELIAIDKERRALQQKSDSLKQQQNEASKQIPQIKKSGGDVSEILAKMTEIKQQVKENDEKIAALADRQKQIDLVPARDADPIVQLAGRRVRHHAAVLDDRFAVRFEDRGDRVVDSVFLY